MRGGGGVRANLDAAGGGTYLIFPLVKHSPLQSTALRSSNHDDDDDQFSDDHNSSGKYLRVKKTIHIFFSSLFILV